MSRMSDRLRGTVARSIAIACLGMIFLVASHSIAVATGQRAAIENLVGTWQMVSRVDRDVGGNVFPESSLGSDPIGYLIYDASGHVAVQLMARQRPAVPCQVTTSAASNNVGHIGGYDAFFGRYEVDSTAGTVTHILGRGYLAGDVGRRLTRRFKLVGDSLTLEFEPGGPTAGRTRTLTWRRVSRFGQWPLNNRLPRTVMDKVSRRMDQRAAGNEFVCEGEP